MDWIKRLNQGPRLIALGEGVAEVLDWAYSPHLPDNVPHRHAHFELCQVGAYGSGHFIVEDRPYAICPGDLFIARPGVVHQIVNHTHPDMELFWVSFLLTPKADPPRGEVDALLHMFAGSPVVVVADAERSIAALWQALRTVAQGSPRAGYDTQLSGLTASLLIAMAQAGAGPAALLTEAAVEQDGGAVRARLAARYVHDNLDRRLSVSEIAAHVHLSPRQLSRLFARLIGTSPAAYVEQTRLERACALLQQSGAPIKSIAAAVGYDSVHHFSRAFSRRFACSPGAFRQTNARAVPKSQRRDGSGQRHADAPLLQ
ncbi:MAG: AraC family transcriptional regulator [Deinococcota bacterium]|jgi:AraC family L-rhamnose operon transcriptional activator RhaR|nr:AraC family transcriptional regulator [Deinococcota bacterium]MDQ3460773.1 AraC family transcriptional regulator [Deinococcota bacterium]